MKTDPMVAEWALKIRDLTKSWLKQLSTESEPEDIYLSLHKSVQFINLTDRGSDIFRLIRTYTNRYKFEKKHKNYSLILKKHHKNAQKCIAYDDCSPRYSYNLNKSLILDKLLDLSKRLTYDYNVERENEFRQYEKDLECYLAVEDLEILFPSKETREKTLRKFVKKINRLISCLYRKLTTCEKRDGRSELRDIVRPHFKNMDDEPDANGIFTFDENFITFKTSSRWTTEKQLKYSTIY